MAKKNPNNRSSKPSFAGIPRIVMENLSYINIGPSAKTLLFEAAYQFKGKNNGDICFAWTLMKERGWKSKATLAKAVSELVEEELIVLSRQGHFRKPFNRCSLYAITWQSVDECPNKDLELPPTLRPLRNFTAEYKKRDNKKQGTQY
jgi:hypothetical protein